MAIGTPTQRKTSSPAATATSVFSPGSTVVAGTVAILFGTGGANKMISSVTDSVGNTWTVDVAFSDGTRAASCASCQVAAQITTSDTITVTWSSATNNEVQIQVQEVTGLAASAVFDKSATANGNSTTPSAGPTATLSQTDEIVFGFGRMTAGGTWTKGAGYTDPTTPQLGSGGLSWLEYKIVAADTAVTADGTWSGSSTWAAVVATYKAPVVAQPRFGFSSFQDPAVFMRRQLSGLLVPERKVWLPT